ncbi:MAG: AAA family ATPase [Eubacteriales bacterium]|nr:AAA family ATPase [Eubacteriales bacterium]
MENVAQIYEKLKKELEQLPAGYISKKNINGKPQYYLQWRENGKMKSKYIRKSDLETVEQQISKRKRLEATVERLKPMLPKKEDGSMSYEINAMPCRDIMDRLDIAAKLPRRDCFARLIKCLYADDMTRVTVVYGLRRTGKTTMLYQAMAEMTDEVKEKAVYIKMRTDNDMAQLNRDMYRLKEAGYRYIFIDEVTLAKDFIDGASLFSDVFTAMGMHIVLSGTDSLGFWFAEGNELYDRVRMIHTTFIPYREYSRLLGIDSIDEYIRYGGTLRAGEIKFDDDELNDEDASFRDDESTRRYVDTAIAKNIQHSLSCYENGTHFRHLHDLYEANELTNAINRIVEDMNHRFLLSVLTKDFVSSDLSIASKNLRKERDESRRTLILDEIDREAVTKRMMEILDIRNKEDRKIGIRHEHMEEIRQYLKSLDLIVYGLTESVEKGYQSEEYVMFTQPGMRYCQAQALAHSLMQDEAFGALSDPQRTMVTKRILEEVRGRMLEDIIRLETAKALPVKRYKVFKLEFERGEFDLAIRDKDTNTCALYEIKHSSQCVKQQARHLMNKEVCANAAWRYGSIVGRYVLYLGENLDTEDGIAYRNAGQFLKQLPGITLESGLEEIASEDEDPGFTPTM